jgi:hypothetical protein
MSPLTRSEDEQTDDPARGQVIGRERSGARVRGPVGPGAGVPGEAIRCAKWRTEAGLPLLFPRPGGGTPDDYVDELATRFAQLGIET